MEVQYLLVVQIHYKQSLGVAVVLHIHALAVSHVDQSSCVPAVGWMIFLR